MHYVSKFTAHLCCSIYWPHSYMATFLDILTLYKLSSSSWYHCGIKFSISLSIDFHHSVFKNSPFHLIACFYSFNSLLTNNATRNLGFWNISLPYHYLLLKGFVNEFWKSFYSEVSIPIPVAAWPPYLCTRFQPLFLLLGLCLCSSPLFGVYSKYFLSLVNYHHDKNVWDLLQSS